MKYVDFRTNRTIPSDCYALVQALVVNHDVLGDTAVF